MIEPIKGKSHLIVKRDGRSEMYNPSKLRRAIKWCCKGSDVLTDELIHSIDIKIHSKMKIEKLWDTVINTAANKISPMYLSWDSVAKRAYILKIYKEVYHTASKDSYPDFVEVITKGVHNKVISSEVFDYFSKDELTTIGTFINPEYDLDFKFIGIVTIMEKYSMQANTSTKLELPQHIYMRVAMEAFKADKSNEKLSKIQIRYTHLAKGIYTEATPKMVNSLSPNAQLASCVLQAVGDSIESINYVDASLAQFSKYGGGLAVDVSDVRCKGSLIGTQGGRSNGVVPFIQKFESTVNAFDQLSTRKGAAVITFPFWNYDVLDLLILKDAGGSEDSRARKLQYTMKWYNILTERIKTDSDITLFDPKEVPLLNTTWGDDFTSAYEMYEQKVGLRKRKIKARTLAFSFIKARSETGNMYVVFPDNINSQRVGEKAVFASNLCTEIFLPVEDNKKFKSVIHTNFTTGKPTTLCSSTTGEIALCNLTSLNVVTWVALTYEEKRLLITNLLEASDNLIDTQFYPVAEGEYANKKRRAIGIGISNYAHYLASLGLLYTDKEALKVTHELMEDISYHCILGSTLLAKERGSYSTIKGSQWEKGIFSKDLYVGTFNFPLVHNWGALKTLVKANGVRFSYLMALPPTATSAQTIGATEGIEPIKKLSSFKEGTYTLPVLVPNITKYRQFYQSAFDIPNTVINDLASVRQKFIDQGQSVSHYYKETDSAYEILLDVMDAERKGLKSLYYLQPMKSDDVEACESCSA